MEILLKHLFLNERSFVDRKPRLPYPHLGIREWRDSRFQKTRLHFSQMKNKIRKYFCSLLYQISLSSSWKALWLRIFFSKPLFSNVLHGVGIPTCRQGRGGAQSSHQLLNLCKSLTCSIAGRRTEWSWTNWLIFPCCFADAPTQNPRSTHGIGHIEWIRLSRKKFLFKLQFQLRLLVYYGKTSWFCFLDCVGKQNFVRRVVPNRLNFLARTYKH